MDTFDRSRGLSLTQRSLKRGFDILLSFAGLIFVGWLFPFIFVVSTIDTRQNGFFTQFRVGRNGRLFRVIKFRTMRVDPRFTTTVTSEADPRITKIGRLLRETKLDELPQLINVFKGDMSFVGPRPDVPGFADLLEGSDRVILTVRPGITGPATLRFRAEESELGRQEDPEEHNRNVIWREKVRLNRLYIEHYRFRNDILYILRTVLPPNTPGAERN